MKSALAFTGDDMTPQILSYIRSLSATDKKTLSQKALKTAEEVGELAKVVLPFEGAASTTHRFVAKERILEEAMDVVLCALSVAHDLNFSDEEIGAMMMRKAKYWQELQQREQKVSYPLPYEIHVTIEAGTEGIELERFKETCREIGVKPLLIDMHNRQGATVMLDAQTSSVFMGDNAGAITEAQRISGALNKAGFKAVREKIETVPWHPAAPSRAHENPVMPPNCYFEAHFNIIVTSETHERLRSVLVETEAHLSRNAFKMITDTEYVAMATLRQSTGTFEDFTEACDTLVSHLSDCGFAVPKTITEFSIFDTKVSHDANWLTK